MRGFLFSLLALALLIPSAHAYSEEERLVGDEVARQMLMVALARIDQALCRREPCAPATAAEKANPPISIPEARFVIIRGFMGAFAQQCGLNWRDQSFLPMMQYWHQTMKKNERQMALIGLLHGIAMGVVERRIECSAEERRNLDRDLTLEFDLTGQPKKRPEKRLNVL